MSQPNEQRQLPTTWSLKCIVFILLVFAANFALFASFRILEENQSMLTFNGVLQDIDGHTLAETNVPLLSTNPPDSPPSLSPTRRITDVDRCLSNPRFTKSSKPINTVWNCTSEDPTIRHEAFEIQSDPPMDILALPAVYLTGGNWGQLCNKLGMIAGTLATMRKANQSSTSLLAIQPAFSEPIWALDLDALSSSVRAVLLDCFPCTKDESIVRCGTMYIHKRGMFNINAHAIQVSKRYEASFLFYKTRPRNRGYVRELTESIAPSRFLTNLVLRLMKKKYASKTTIGLHRRYMDNMCYTFATAKTQYNCFPNHLWTITADKIARLRDTKGGVWDPRTTLRNLNDSAKDQVEAQFPLLLTCNYTFNENQIRLINSTWPLLLQSKPFTIIVADDHQTVAGRRAMEQSTVAHEVVSLDQMESNDCFTNKKFHNMLADMVMMAHSDLHMGMVLSSCDDIVAHWRKALGKPLGTSYPPVCYDGFYTGKET